MKQRSGRLRPSPAPAPGVVNTPLPAMARELAARYLYCIAQAGEAVSLGAVGIEGREVYTVVLKDLCALVHDGPARPYQSEAPEVAAAWVLAHHQVVEVAWKRWGAVLPLTFNTIIQGERGNAPEALATWLETEYAALKQRLQALAGKAEYGVQVFWEAALISKQAAGASPEIRQLQQDIASKPRGLAYMYRQQLERLLKKELETRAADEFQYLYGRLSRCADKTRVEKTKRSEAGRQMLMNLSCLVSPEQCPGLTAELDQVSNREGYAVRLVGPLPPYSFC